ncbi:hypothetical protein UCRPC4_g05862 [Phaeomoniella chlamydospora]|uniref:Uncharacterized protein n=1 Tax=Phaeomoniella chlamydospora TaxID=158046 RepID=A0A0G2E1G4_PHACM|nr:hypothetical protein UCRPC4_g05862 [Phaeomoniella chlamydospora]
MSATATMHSPVSHRPQKKQKMSITQTYFLAHTARGKLSKEAGRADHDLRLLVGHANLLDTLMLDLANAEAEQENWFNHTVSGAKAADEESQTRQDPKHIQWAETVVEEPEEDWQAEDAITSDSDSDDDEDERTSITARSVSVVKPEFAPATITTREVDDDEDMEEDEDAEFEELALTRTASHHPPELTSDSEDDSDEDDSMPPSPPTATYDAFTEKQRQAIATTSYYDKQRESSPSSKTASTAQLSDSEQNATDFFEDGYYLPSTRQQPAVLAVAAY